MAEQHDGMPAQASAARRVGAGKATLGTGWDSYFDATPQAPEHLSLEDANDAMVEAMEEPSAEVCQAERPNGDSTALVLPGGDTWRNLPGPDGKIPDERVSHLMCRVLRYHTESVGLAADEEGWVSVSDLLRKMPELENNTVEDVRRVVQDSVGPKGARFELREAPRETGMETGSVDAEVESESAGLQIRATYRHPKDGRRLHGERRAFRHRGHYGQLAPWGGNGRSGFSQISDTYDAWDGYKVGETGDIPPRLEPAPRQLALCQGGERSDHHNGNNSWYGASAAGTTNGSAVESAAEPRSMQDRWERYIDPETNATWFWHEATDEVFYADDEKSGWEMFEDSEGRPWWWHEATSRYFFEEQ